MDKRQQLYKEISEADELLLQLLLDTALEYKSKTPEANELLLSVLNKRRDAHLRGESKSYSREEAFRLIRKENMNGSL